MAADPNIIANSGLPASAGADDHNWAFFSARSGLTPAKDYAVTSHKIAYMRTQLGSSLTHIDDLNKAWKDSGKSYAGAVYSETWTGANGSAWPAQWVNVKSDAGSSATIQNNAGQLNPGTASFGSIRRNIASGTPTGDFDLTLSVVFAVQDQGYFGIDANSDTLANSNNPFYPQNGYHLEFGVTSTAANGTIQLLRFVNNTGAVTVIGSITRTLTAGTAYKVRMKRTGQTLQYKVWTGAEPGTWDASGTDSGTQPSAAGVGLSAGTGGSSINTIATFDDLSIS